MISKKPNIEMTDLPMGYTRLEDAPRPTSPTRPGAGQGINEIATDIESGVQRKAGSSRDRWLKLAAVGMGGMLLGGGLAAAAAVPVASRSRHGGAVRTPTHPMSNLPPCVAPETVAGAPLQATAQVNANSPMFIGGRPHIGDIRRVDSNVYGDDQYAMLESLVARHPDFIAGNLREAGFDANGTRHVHARSFALTSDTGRGVQAQIDVQLSGGQKEGDQNTAAWPLVLEAASDAVWRTSAMSARGSAQGEGDTSDYNSDERFFGTVISGHPVNVFSLNRLTYLNNLVGNRRELDNPSGGPAAAFLDKDDNIPFMIDMLRTDASLFGAVYFSKSEVAYLPVQEAILSQGTAVTRYADSTIGIAPSSAPAWNVSFSAYDGSNAMSITGADENGLNLRSFLDAPSAADRVLPYEAMVYAASKISIGRTSCDAEVPPAQGVLTATK